MIIFIKGHQQTGIHRYLEGLTIYDGIKIICVNDIVETNQYEDEVGIFGGFLPYDLRQNTSIKTKYYTYCSPLGQADLSSGDFYAAEIRTLYLLLAEIRQGHIKNSITPSLSLRDRFNFIYTPPVRTNIEDKIIFNNTRQNYGIMGNNLRKHKNIANQIAAVSMLTPKQPIVLSGLVKNYNVWSEMFECEFISKDLSSDDDYYKEIASHKLGFQCTHSESFDYIAYEYAFMGVPTICSPCVDWYPVHSCVVENIDNVENIRRVAQTLISEPNMYDDISYKLAGWAPVYNQQQKEKLQEVCKELDHEQ